MDRWFVSHATIERTWFERDESSRNIKFYETRFQSVSIMPTHPHQAGITHILKS